MKINFKILSTAAIVAASLSSYAQNVSYTIKGSVGQLNYPAKAYLFYYNALGRKIDSAVFNQGKFVFNGIIDQPKAAGIYISKTGAGFESSGPGYVLLYLESGKIDINSTSTIDHATVLGGPINTDNNRLNTLLKDNNAEFQKIRESYNAISNEGKKTKEFIDSVAKRNDQLVAERKAIYLAFIKKNPSAMMSLFALKNYERPVANVADVEPIFDMLSAGIRQSVAGQSYAAEIARMKHIEIGALAPDFTLMDTLGKAISLHDFKGKYVLVDFWASWCPPCRADNPNVYKIYEAYKDKNLIVLSVSLDDVKSKWLTAIHEDKLPWTQLTDLKAYNLGGVAKQYSLNSIPQNFLIGPDGKIIDKATSTVGLPGKLKTILDK